MFRSGWGRVKPAASAALTPAQATKRGPRGDLKPTRRNLLPRLAPGPVRRLAVGVDVEAFAPPLGQARPEREVGDRVGTNGDHGGPDQPRGDDGGLHDHPLDDEVAGADPVAAAGFRPGNVAFGCITVVADPSWSAVNGSGLVAGPR